MTVLELLKNASFYLNLDDEFAPYFDSSSVTPNDETKREWGKMLCAFNSLIKSIATERIPLTKEEEIAFDCNGEFLLNTLAEKFHSIQTITGYSGFVFASSSNDGKLKSNYKGPAVLKYAYVPADFVVEDEVSVFDGVLNDLVYSYGIAYIYCEMYALYDDAQMWKEKFEKAINDCMSGVVRERVMRVRRWLN
ncbi:MAG: hypothetical protein EOM55_01290 [Clostridia bacterium]|nr:hypothetical protein [Clostridia bacterium]